MKDKHFCRCCLSEECYKDMANTYYFGKVTENYFEMLLDVFNINITNTDSQRYLICEDCVSKIRDALAFKKKVLAVQETITKDLCWENNNTDLYTNKVLKMEDTDFEDFDDNISDSFGDNDFKWEYFNDRSQKGQVFFVINTDSKEEQSQFDISQCYKKGIEQNKHRNSSMFSHKTTKRDKNTSMLEHRSERSKNSSSLKPIVDENASNVETFNKEVYSHDNDIETLDSEEDEDFNTPKSSNTIKKGPTLKATVKTKAGLAHKRKVIKTKTKRVSQTETTLKYKRENTLKLIENSNLCLFRSFQNKFGCNFCQMKFTEFNQLREHSLSHGNTAIATQINRLRGLSCKNAEISDLNCKLCSENFPDLLKLTDHLKNKHEISFHGTEHYLVPYKLQNGFQCLSCKLKFNTYLRLNIHMNTHSTNNVCEMCGLSFINRHSLLTHVHSQHREKKCSLCPAIFLTNASKSKHLRQVHDIRYSKRYCNLCNKTFRYSYMVNEHKIQEHGIVRQEYSCTECGKIFLSEINLKIHVRSVHMRERNYPCTKCGTRFFTKRDQLRHERTHEDVRSFSCSYCEAKFKSKDSWRRHLKRQHGHVFGKTS